ncbi:deleted in malignant brain tumors 1 protein isoform X2 [Strongylocentrotus purpuratus]|uniref:CUB domain-containing protein n=1 Tax=Strongylocentrotus purpuratus TaxID=7668 RepID=A0A7M7N221_STRPU|nr:deleted in malignant brain tumors 1 protein isoform X2 [Strongylocentrotus purpuratus]XP_030830018.1 deleted in malignant brain tumors 1 protein isoform X2 [Strongylocentrotus purpuratus]XP_030830019.1 deleted in malignant brain tumors 1 protein isoform X2 [Strongylocentrotus purpuratus]
MNPISELEIVFRSNPFWQRGIFREEGPAATPKTWSERTRSLSLLNLMTIMHPVYTLSLLYVLLAPRFGRVNADGETVSITLKCGDIKNVTSPNYPDNYNNNLKIHWNVRADLAQRILVTFNDFQTEESDYLRIEEENYTSVKAEYRGSKLATPYISLWNHLAIIFTSDSSESRTGFHLSISCFKETDYTGIHEAFEGLEHTRVMMQPVCTDAWHTDVADTVCREAGFPGSYETIFTKRLRISRNHRE